MRIELERYYCNGVHVATQEIDSADFYAIKDQVLADPVKHGYADHLETLYYYGVIDQVDLIKAEEIVFVGNSD